MGLFSSLRSRTLARVDRGMPLLFSVKHGYLLEYPSISYAERYGVGTISRKGPASSSDYAAESSETIRHASDIIYLSDEG